MGEPTQVEWRSRKNAHMRPKLPSDNEITLGHNKAFDPQAFHNKSQLPCSQQLRLPGLT